jgi:3-oxoacyl-[acyl-carrier-protein] synthase II
VSTQDAVWITGVGAATPLGQSFAVLGDNLMAGKSGVGPVTHFNASTHPSRIAACLGPIAVPSGWDADDFAKLGPWEQLLVSTVTQALQDSGWWEARDQVRIGIVAGIGAEWLLSWEADMRAGGRRVHEPAGDGAGLVRWLRDRLGLTGPATTTAAACASGNIALGLGRQWVRQGWVDVCLAGACDRSVTPMGMAGFGNLGALSKRNDAPAAASRPFDRGRDGFVMAEGSAFFVLESAERARQRGARGYGEIAGFGASSDAFHMVMPSQDPVPAAQAIRVALQDASVAPDSVDYLNAHATSTPLGDVFEARVLHAVLGDAVRTVPVSSTKSMTGHLLSAASAIEALACLAALERQAIPPTINLDDPDPECGLCHVAHHAREAKLDVVASNSFGFGGSNTCLVLRRVA